jgi:hypothetical protein
MVLGTPADSPLAIFDDRSALLTADVPQCGSSLCMMSSALIFLSNIAVFARQVAALCRIRLFWGVLTSQR